MLLDVGLVACEHLDGEGEVKAPCESNEAEPDETIVFDGKPDPEKVVCCNNKEGVKGEKVGGEGDDEVGF